ncbi:EXS-domain-containing protein, partial [Jimgerdemannia flammicorona]
MDGFTIPNYLFTDTLTAFRTLLPFFYRPLIIITIGIWGWALNLHILSTLGIDTPALMHVHHTGAGLYRPIYAIATVVTAVVGVNLWCFWATFIGAGAAENGEEQVTRTWLPTFCYFTVVVMVTMPGNVFYKKERTRFLRWVLIVAFGGDGSLRRIFSLNLFSEVYFSDVILADILTSFAKVLGDLYTTICVLAVGRGSIDFLLDEDSDRCWRDVMVPMMTSIPHLLRFRQCISEYLGSNCANRRHLLNALKYASALPVIMLSAMQKVRSGSGNQEHIILEGGEDAWIGDIGLFRLWLFFVCINSMYSFYWDVVVDWNFITHPGIHPTDSSPPHSPRTRSTSSIKRQPFTLVSLFYSLKSTISRATAPYLRVRTTLHFSEPSVYYLAVLVDFLLRTTWSLKLSSHLYIAQLEGSIFLMELLEVTRRWVWVFFRMESEWVKRGAPYAGVGMGVPMKALSPGGEYAIVSTGSGEREMGLGRRGSG